MRHIFSFFLFFGLFLFSITPAEAHFRGVPIVKINSEYTKVYFEDIYAIGDEYLPQDIASKPFLVNKPITFEIDAKLLPYPEEVIKQTTFDWDFGDGTKKRGTKVEHTFREIGSQTVTINIKYGDLSKFGYFNEGFSQADQQQAEQQSVLIHIIPNANYKVPKAVITVDGKKILDPKKDRINFKLKDWGIGPLKFNKTFSFDASNSEAPSGKIVSYLWELGGGATKTKSQKSFKFTYRDDWWIYSPALRIKDENGFVSHTTVTMYNEDKENNQAGSSDEETEGNSNILTYLLVGNVGLIGLGAIGFTIWKIREKKKHKKEE